MGLRRDVLTEARSLGFGDATHEISRVCHELSQTFRVTITKTEYGVYVDRQSYGGVYVRKVEVLLGSPCCLV